MKDKDTDGRSAAFAGIEGLARRYEDERVSLSEIANIVGCSRQMVWDDLVRHLGRLPHPPARHARARGFDGPRLFLAHFADDGREAPAAAADLVVHAYQDFEADSIERLSDRVLAVMQKGAFRAQLRLDPGRARERFTRVMINASIGVFDEIYIIVLSGSDARCFHFSGREAAKIIRKVITQMETEDGWVPLGAVGTHLANFASDFDPRTYGFRKLSDLARETVAFEIDHPEGGSLRIKAKPSSNGRRKSRGRKAS